MLTLIIAIVLSLMVGACGGFLIACIFRTAGCVLVACLVFGPGTAKAECLPSAQAVWQAHGGGHATWRAGGDHRCWMAGHGHSRRHVARHPVPREKPRQFVKDAELRSLFPERLPAGCPQARINEAFAVMGMGR